MLSLEVGPVVTALDAVVKEARQQREFPEIFDDTRLVATMHDVIHRSGLPIDTAKQRRHAERMSAYCIGRYMQQHKLGIYN